MRPGIEDTHRKGNILTRKAYPRVIALDTHCQKEKTQLSSG